jgi:transcription antitermination protein NusB
MGGQSKGRNAPDHQRAGARRASRRLVAQALYQHQIAGHAEAELLAQYREDPDFAKADAEYFEASLAGVLAEREALDGQLEGFVDRPLVQLDPIEHGILLLGLWELSARIDVPYRVVIKEAVALTKRFGAEEGHRFVNAVLDRAARELRAHETKAARA